MSALTESQSKQQPAGSIYGCLTWTCYGYSVHFREKLSNGDRVTDRKDEPLARDWDVATDLLDSMVSDGDIDYWEDWA